MFTHLAAWLKPEYARFTPAPRQIPPVLLDEYTMGSKIPIAEFFSEEGYLGGVAKTPIWTRDYIDAMVKNSRTPGRRDVHWHYDKLDTSFIFDAVDRWGPVGIDGKRCLVVGSETPWVEAILLGYGAREVSTLEFGKIESQHPQVTTFTPSTFTTGFLRGLIPQFDCLFSYSSIEHDGLGESCHMGLFGRDS